MLRTIAQVAQEDLVFLSSIRVGSFCSNTLGATMTWLAGTLAVLEPKLRELSFAK